MVHVSSPDPTPTTGSSSQYIKVGPWGHTKCNDMHKGNKQSFNDVLATRQQSLTDRRVVVFTTPSTSAVGVPPTGPIWASMRVQHNLTKKKNPISSKTNERINRYLLSRTDVVRRVRVARAPPASPRIAGRAMRILVMRIADLVEKVDTFRAREECRTDRVHVRIAPALFIHTRFPNRTKRF